MDIREYNTKNLPYRYVLFYNLPEERLITYRECFQGQECDNALLTYCYLDRECGLSFRAICWAKVSENGDIEYHDNREMKTMLIIREGGLNCDAIVLDDSIMSHFKHYADEIKDNYGYLEDQVLIRKGVLFDEFRHPSYPDDIMAVFISPDQQIEKMWVREQFLTDDGGIVAELLNEPYNALMGVHEGDMVKIVPHDFGDGNMTPTAVLDWMKKQEE